MNCVLLRASHIPILVFVFFGLARGAYLVDFSNMMQHRNNLANVKRDGKSGQINIELSIINKYKSTVAKSIHRLIHRFSLHRKANSDRQTENW